MKSIRWTAWAVAGISAVAFPLAPATASDGQHANQGKDYTFAVIGDIPYGDAEIAAFPQVVAQINADPDVSLVSHLGDIKDGSSLCTTEYFRMIKSDFDRFADPLVYTIGDNEWTDCHRPNDGSFNPLGRLAKVRSIFFPHPGATLGQHPVTVDSQSASGYPENVRFTREYVAFASVHIVGSNNSLEPWTGNAAPTPEQTAEVLGRTASTIQVIHDTFASAARHHDRAVVLMTQADMFDPTVPDPSYADYFAFTPIVAAIARESAAFGRPVYLFNGDSHVYNSDKPLDSGSEWLTFYGVRIPAPNLIRITVDGSSNAKDYLKVTIGRDRQHPLTWTRIPFGSPHGSADPRGGR
jgi:hypothetical protein